jgi:hypothetical protein
MKHNIMLWKSGRLVGFILMVTLVCLTSAPASRFASAAPARHEEYQALVTIENIDSATGTITVRLSDGTEKTLRLPKHMTVDGRPEGMSRAESALKIQEHAVVDYKVNGADETAVDVESLNHAMHKTVTGTLISVDRDRKTVVLRTVNGKEETFRLQNDAVIETTDNVVTFDQFEPQSGEQITLHYRDPLGMTEVSRIKH